MFRPSLTVLALALACSGPAAQASGAPPGAPAKTARPAKAPAPATPVAMPAVPAATAGNGRCIDEDRSDAAAPAPASPAEPAAPAGVAAAADPRMALQTLVRDALARSNAIGAAQLLAEAAQSDIEEAQAAKLPQASLSGGFGPGGATQGAYRQTALAQLRGGVNVSQLLYDGGRADGMTQWRKQLAESARYGHLSQKEQVALTAVTLALERSRYRLQTQVYKQSARRMACLVEALDTIVRADRGRTSELVQASKNWQQAELSVSQSDSMIRQIDARLRKLVGDALPEVAGVVSVFNGVPEREALMADVERSYDIAQLDAQVAAARTYADVVAAGGNPQVSLSGNVGGSVAAGGNTTGGSKATNYALGVTVAVPLYNPSLAPATDAARKRSRAAALQRAEEVESRRARVAELHEQALAALDRVKRLSEVLRDSDQVRTFTLQQWQQLGRRSLFDVMGAENEHYSLRVAYVNALHDVQAINAQLLSLGRGVGAWLQ